MYAAAAAAAVILSGWENVIDKVNFPWGWNGKLGNLKKAYYGLDLTVKDTGNIYLELELAPAPSVVW